MKFNKRYRLTVQVDDAGNSVEIDYPLTCEFNIIRTIFSGANTGKFTIYNLGEDTRNKIFHDLYDPKTIRKLTFQAGYADQNPLPIAFQGRVQVAYSTRKGVNWVTEIKAFDADLDSQTAQAVPAGTSIRDTIGRLMGNLLHASKGTVGNFPVKSETGASYAGNTWSIISSVAQDNGGTAFIDNGVAHVLKPGEYAAEIPNASPIISGATGLLRVQMQFKSRVDVEIMLDTNRAIGQLVQLQSEVEQNNGNYVVKGVSHRGVISGAKDSETITLLNLQNGTGAIPAGLMV